MFISALHCPLRSESIGLEVELIKLIKSINNITEFYAFDVSKRLKQRPDMPLSKDLLIDVFWEII